MDWKKLVRNRIVRGVFGVGILGGGFVAGTVLADPMDESKSPDWQLSLQGRNALWDDSTFEKLNLGVQVRNGIAYLSGPIPSKALTQQALERLRKVPGIRDVVDETFVPPADEPLAQSMPRVVTTHRPTVSVAPAATAPGPYTAPAAAQSQQRDSAPAISLGPPVALPVKAMTLTDQIENLRSKDRRFQNVRVEVNNGVVTLRGTVVKSADAWELAAMIRQLAGVTRVVQAITTATQR